MKKCLVTHLALGFSLVALPFIGGCTRQSTGGSNPFVNSASAEPVGGENNLAAVTEAVTNAPATTEAATNLIAVSNVAAVAEQTNTTAQVQAEGAETAAPKEQKPPSNLQLSPVLSEAVKLVQAGVDQSVLANFITNTTGYFMLGADEIVYLNDLGVEGSIITTMMEHDRALRELRSSAWQAYAATNQATQEVAQPEPPDSETAAAPSYVQPPPMEAEPAYVSNEYFYDTLSPYGTWVYVPGYGSCWRPTAGCNPGWRPYCDRGRWVYSDCGWYWLSDYTWGATTFHYGRWFNDARLGWCWWPDNVWAPSWVNWRYTSDYCGWAPLPPNCYYQSGFGLMYTSGSVGVSFGFGLGCSSYAFVPWGSFCSPRPYQHCVPASTAIHVYNNSKPYNHWESGGKGKAYNRGLAPDRVRDLSRAEVRTVSIKEQTGRNLRAERIDRDGQTLAVRRPQFTSTAANVTTTSGAAGRPTGRQSVASTPIDPAVSSVSQRPTSASVTSTLAPSATRIDTRNQREQWMANRTSGRSPAPVTSAGDQPAVTKPPGATATLVENRPDGRVETETVIRPRTTSPAVVRPVQQQTPVATTTEQSLPGAQTPQSRVIQPNRQSVSRPSTTAQRSSIIVIGGGNNSNNRSGGRDYSVWSTSPQSPAPTTSAENNNNSRGSQPTTVNTPQVADNSPAPVSRPQNGNWQNRGSYNRSDNSGSNQSQDYSAPQVGQVVGQNARSVPSANYGARPTQSSSTQPSAGRSESRPAPAQSSRSSAPAASQSGQGQGRSR